MEARRSPGLNNAPTCTWSMSPPPELNGISPHALDANAGFVTFGKIGSFCWNIYFSNSFYFLSFVLLLLLKIILLFSLSDHPSPRGCQKTGKNCLVFINISRICQLSCKGESSVLDFFPSY